MILRPESPTKRLLLVSSSKVYGSGYLDHAEADIRDHFRGVGEVLFVPYALQDLDGYAQVARERFERMGFRLRSIHSEKDARAAVEQAEGIFIGGGNTFRLLDWLYRQNLLETIRRRAEAGMPYMGSSAGSVVACPTIRTTNDMPIVQPPSFDALGLVGFQINGHYLDPDPNSTHMGETRETRLREFLEENDAVVVGIREGAFLRVRDGEVLLKGTVGARIFRRGQEQLEVKPGTVLTAS